METRETFAAARVALDDLRLARQITVALTAPVAPLVQTIAGAGGDPAAAAPTGRVRRTP
jgi:hypothetical protein